MSIYKHITGLAEHQTILYLAHSHRHAESAFHNCAEAAGDKASTIRRAHGEQGITFPGGRIMFGSVNTHFARGRSYDHVVLDGHHHLDSERFRDELAPGFTGPERYTVIG